MFDIPQCKETNAAANRQDERRSEKCPKDAGCGHSYVTPAWAGARGLMLASYRLDSRLRGNDGIYGFRPKVLYHKSLLCDFRVSFVVKKANHKEHKGLTKYTKSEKVWVLFLWAEALCLVSLDSRLRGNDEKRYIIFWQKPNIYASFIIYASQSILSASQFHRASTCVF